MRAGLVVALLAATAVTYAPVRTNSYVYEDSNAAWANPAVLGHQAIDVTRARWLTALSHRLVFTFLSPKPTASHLVNLGLHLVNGVLVYSIAVAWLSPFGALAATAAFLLHPLQTEAVAYVASRSELLSLTFALLAFWFNERAWRIASWLCVALALCAKETAIMIVPLMALADWLKGRRFSWLRVGCLLVPGVLIAASVIWFDYTSRSEIGPLGYAATQATAVWRYLGLVVWPVGLSLDHDFELVPWAVRWLALVGLTSGTILLVLLLCSTWNDDMSVRRRLCVELGVPLSVVFGALWVVIALAPRFVMRQPEILNEHQFLMPMVGLALVIGAAFGGERE